MELQWWAMVNLFTWMQNHCKVSFAIQSSLIALYRRFHNSDFWFSFKLQHKTGSQTTVGKLCKITAREIYPHRKPPKLILVAENSSSENVRSALVADKVGNTTTTKCNHNKMTIHLKHPCAISIQPLYYSFSLLHLWICIYHIVTMEPLLYVCI